MSANGDTDVEKAVQHVRVGLWNDNAFKGGENEITCCYESCSDPRHRAEKGLPVIGITGLRRSGKSTIGNAVLNVVAYPEAYDTLATGEDENQVTLQVWQIAAKIPDKDKPQTQYAAFKLVDTPGHGEQGEHMSYVARGVLKRQFTFGDLELEFADVTLRKNVDFSMKPNVFIWVENANDDAWKACDSDEPSEELRTRMTERVKLIKKMKEEVNKAAFDYNRASMYIVLNTVPELGVQPNDELETAYAKRAEKVRKYLGDNQHGLTDQIVCVFTSKPPENSSELLAADEKVWRGVCALTLKCIEAAGTVHKKSVKERTVYFRNLHDEEKEQKEKKEKAKEAEEKKEEEEKKKRETKEKSSGGCTLL